MQIIIVSIYGSNKATTPSLVEYGVFAVEWAIAAEPWPDSLENKPLFTPINIVFKNAINAPEATPVAGTSKDGGLNAMVNMVLKELPTWSKFVITINKAQKT